MHPDIDQPTPAAGDSRERDRRLFARVLCVAAALQALLFGFFWLQTQVRLPFSDMLRWIADYLRWREQGDLLEYLWAFHWDEHLVWIRILTAIDVSVFKASGLPFVAVATAALLATAALMFREMRISSVGAGPLAPLAWLVPMLTLTTANVVDCSVPINCQYPLVLAFMVAALLLFDGAADGVNRTYYPNFDIMVVDNGGDDRATLDYLQALERTGAATILRDDRPFNFSALINNAVRHARGEIICLLNNDIEVIAADWLSEMVSHAIRPEIGAVGARLWYPDFTLQHGGVVLGIGGVAGHAHKRLPRGLPGHAHRALLIQNFSAVTAACLVARKAVYQQVGGFDEALAVAFNDVDFCLRVRASGYRILWTPYAELLHRESATRGPEHTQKKQLRFAGEVALMKSRWGELLLCDPAYNPNLTLDRQDFSIAWPPRALLAAQEVRRCEAGTIDPGSSSRGLTASLAAPPVAQRGP